ncbi:MAG: hypothetical protein D4R44_08200 [Actinobacteria bacterium]|nr:MAG: hypothetical protein D4R44_08200 [Actinomycetota bacterium]
MQHVVATLSGGNLVSLHWVSSETTDTTVPSEMMTTTATPMAASATVAETTGPNPISPEMKELKWGAGSFIVLFILMRLVLFPRLKKGMDARYAGIRSDHEDADAAKSGARADVVAYETALNDVRAQAAARIDAARQTLDTERQSQLAQVNSRIAARRAEADQQASAVKAAGRGQISDAVVVIATKATQIASGRTPDAAVVRQAVVSAMESAGAR